MRLKPSGLRCVDISGNFNAVFLCYSVRCLYRYFFAVLRFSNVILYGVYTSISVRFCSFLMLFCTVFIPVFLSIISVFMFVPSLLPPLFGLLSDLKFYYMHVKVSILKPILVF